MIVFYAKHCEGCKGNNALMKMQAECERLGVDFSERRTILWQVYEQEANAIMEINEGLDLPFFYNTETGAVLKGDSFTPLEEIRELINE